MKSSLIFFLAIFIVKISAAQNLIALQSGSSSSFYTKLDSAVYYAQNGDYIYLPGGSFSLSNPLDKSVHIIGVGYFTDSTLATGITQLSGPLTINHGVEGGSIEGIYFFYNQCCDGSINFGDNFNFDPITNFTIKRCYLKYGLKFNTLSTNVTVSESIIATTFGTFSNCAFYNNHIIGPVGGSSCLYQNNVFYYHFYNYCVSGSSSTFTNNIFFCVDAFSNNCIFSNNLNAPNGVFGTNQGFNNVCCEVFDSTFVNDPNAGFDLHNDYHLKPASLGHNAGTDGNDIGLYGGIFPWKDGGVPSNPHLQSVIINGSTDANGNLPVNIKVEAQDH